MFDLFKQISTLLIVVLKPTKNFQPIRNSKVPLLLLFVPYLYRKQVPGMSTPHTYIG